MVHNEQTADYIWFFNNLREVGFENPETVIADRNKAQFNAIQQFYGRRMHIVFCWWHIKGNIINSLPRKNEEIDF
ncbi:unnamed protein product [Blepharisma stoltei]|uniref:MULE transposase domain-containing protein n=1 Tax=Blepharisma stoltei TaxID=1481888 RepID=A0AAU9JFK9_9CILI|nr:unnamed protein product [Blepharisma stoltei]